MADLDAQHEEQSYRGGVTINLADVWRELRVVRDDVRGVKQSVEESIKPQLAEQRVRITSLEIRLYAITAGLIAAFAAGKGFGVL